MSENPCRNLHVAQIVVLVDCFPLSLFIVARFLPTCLAQKMLGLGDFVDKYIVGTGTTLCSTTTVSVFRSLPTREVYVCSR